MRRKTLRWSLVLIVSGLALGCATRFSPATIRSEIVRQRGADPLTQFELNLGRFTTYMLKTALTTETGEVPFAGLSELQLSVYEIPEGQGAAIDVGRIEVRGWEPVVRFGDASRSIMILVRGSGRMPWSADSGSIGDLVVVGAGRRKVVYGRLRGTLSSDLPSRLGDVFRGGGPDAVMQVFSDLEDR